MSHAARSLIPFVVYLIGLGGTLLAAPNPFLGLFGLPPATDVWIRVVGMLALILAYYYWTAARFELTPLIRATVIGRGTVVIFFAAFVAVGWAPPVLVVFGGVDLAAALWTAAGLKKDAGAGQAGS